MQLELSIIAGKPELPMELNADFTQRVAVHSAQLPWKASPMPGVKRRMLDRIGDEVARATTIVSYEPNSSFSPHVHTGGEEFIVLDGVFEDEHGAYPKGSYVRNPPQSAHTPGSTPGCVMLVKLWQFELSDRNHIIINFDKIDQVSDADRPGVSVSPLFKDDRENVRIEMWEAGTEASVETTDGAEIFVLNGSFVEGGDSFDARSWLRTPIGHSTQLVAGSAGARLWIKSGHLPYAKAPQA